MWESSLSQQALSLKIADQKNFLLACIFLSKHIIQFFLLSPISSWSLCRVCFFFCFCFCLLVSQLSSGCKCSRLKICCILAFIDFLLLLQLPRDTQSKLCRLLMGLQCLLFFLYVYLFVLNSYGNFDFFYICFFCSFLF